jgi:hypothetical protein
MDKLLIQHTFWLGIDRLAIATAQSDWHFNRVHKTSLLLAEWTNKQPKTRLKPTLYGRFNGYWGAKIM